MTIRLLRTTLDSDDLIEVEGKRLVRMCAQCAPISLWLFYINISLTNKMPLVAFVVRRTKRQPQQWHWSYAQNGGWSRSSSQTQYE